jgi:putative component of toxin-antitoxin plasmid stabilization module
MVFEVRQLLEFRNWHLALADPKGVKSIAQRIVRLQSGLMGDVKFFDGIGELRIDVDQAIASISASAAGH